VNPLRHWRGWLAGLLAVVLGALLALDASGVIYGPISALTTPAEQTALVSVSPPLDVAVPAAQPVLSALPTDVSPPTPAGVERVVTPLLHAPALGSLTGAVVLDAITGDPLLDSAGSTAFAPASTTKLVTAASALHELGPNARLTTSVVRGSDASDVILVGGGDPTLSTSVNYLGFPVATSLKALAASTARALKAAGLRVVTVHVDDTLFTGPRTAPTWPSAYVTSGVVSPVSALTINEGRISPSSNDRLADPALGAGRAFVNLLARDGIKVSEPVAREKAPASATRLAAVQSAPISALVERMLTVSDNDIAEALARLAGHAAGDGGSFTGGAAAAKATLASFDVPTTGLSLSDGSGLARSDRIAPMTLAQLLAEASKSSEPQLASLVTGMPTAAFSGTLSGRFTVGTVRAGAGTVRAKTGTLSGVSTLAGSVVDAEGRQLVFALMAGNVASVVAAEPALDSVAAALAACGCR
jgi:D-alanyl-D-alanine carboxypeptidase